MSTRFRVQDTFAFRFKTRSPKTAIIVLPSYEPKGENPPERVILYFADGTVAEGVYDKGNTEHLQANLIRRDEEEDNGSSS